MKVEMILPTTAPETATTATTTTRMMAQTTTVVIEMWRLTRPQSGRKAALATGNVEAAVWMEGGIGNGQC